MSEPGTVKCRHCGGLHRVVHGRLCQHCGIAAVPLAAEEEAEGEAQRCPKCGVPTPSDSRRCRSCGNPIPEPEEPAPPPVVEPDDSLRELDLPEGPPVHIADGPVRMAPVEESSNDVDLPEGPPVELATEPVRMDPPYYREVDLEPERPPAAKAPPRRR